MNEVQELIRRRRSCRRYKDDPIPEDILQRICEAGTYAATGNNAQSPIIIAITNKEVRDKLSKLNGEILGGGEYKSDPFFGAPVVLVVLAKKSSRHVRYDGANVMTTLMLAAASEGIASCWIHRARECFETEEWKEFLKSLGIEEEYEGVGNCILGYAKTKAPKAKPRKENYIYYVK